MEQMTIQMHRLLVITLRCRVKGTQIQVRTDNDGKAEFTLVSDRENDTATPVVWVDHNYSNNPQNGILDENDSRSGNVEYTNFQAPYVDDDAAGAELRTIDTEFLDNEGVGFNLVLLNQSGKPYLTKCSTR